MANPVRRCFFPVLDGFQRCTAAASPLHLMIVTMSRIEGFGVEPPQESQDSQVILARSSINVYTQQQPQQLTPSPTSLPVSPGPQASSAHWFHDRVALTDEPTPSPPVGIEIDTDPEPSSRQASANQNGSEALHNSIPPSTQLRRSGRKRKPTTRTVRRARTQRFSWTPELRAVFIGVVLDCKRQQMLELGRYGEMKKAYMKMSEMMVSEGFPASHWAWHRCETRYKEAKSAGYSGNR